MPRIVVILTDAEHAKLATIAARERRRPRDQAAVIILESLRWHDQPQTKLPAVSPDIPELATADEPD